MMPIRDVVIFPYMMTPFVVGRESSVRALEEALAADKKIFLATQHDAGVDEPKPNASSHGYATAGWVVAPAIGRVIQRMAPLLGIEPIPDQPPVADSAHLVPVSATTE